MCIVKRYSISRQLKSEAMLIPNRDNILFLQGSNKPLDQPAEGSVLCISVETRYLLQHYVQFGLITNTGQMRLDTSHVIAISCL